MNTCTICILDHEEVSAPIQETVQQHTPKGGKKPIPLPRSKQCHSLMTNPQKTDIPTTNTLALQSEASVERPTPLPRTTPSPPATPPWQRESTAPSTSVAQPDTEEDFTGGTGDSGLGTGESDRSTWITNSGSQTVYASLHIGILII